MRREVADYFSRYQSIPGWFSREDFLLFDFLLSHQEGGDLMEIGVYKGASAILLGLHRRDGESLTVCDLFGLPEEDEANRAESEQLYPDISRQSFENTYLAFLPELPTIFEGSSLEITEHVEPASCRFVHIDGSHLYEYVRADIGATRGLLKPEGVVAIDDWRNLDTPGVTLAVMEQVAVHELHTVAITSGKFYGSWNRVHASGLRTSVTEWARANRDLILHIEVLREEEWPRLALPQAGTRPAVRTRIVSRIRRRALGREFD